MPGPTPDHAVAAPAAVEPDPAPAPARSPAPAPGHSPTPAPAPGRHPFAYAIVRVVPRVERGESMNAGIVLLCRPKRFLGARVALDERRLAALDPACDPDEVRSHLAAIERIAAGDPAGGPIAALSQPERYHWLVAPSSTIIQPSEAHTGLTADPAATLDHLFATLVEAPADPDAETGG